LEATASINSREYATLQNEMAAAAGQSLPYPNAAI
jgi:hypothetical protein